MIVVSLHSDQVVLFKAWPELGTQFLTPVFATLRDFHRVAGPQRHPLSGRRRVDNCEVVQGPLRCWHGSVS